METKQFGKTFNRAKKNVVFAIILFTALTNMVHSQYESIIVEDSTYWKYVFKTYTPENMSCEKDSIVLKGDTIIDGDKYYIINSFSSVYSLTTPHKVDFLQEDTINGKLWFFGADYPYNGDPSKKILIMDLSLNMGDTFHIPIRDFWNGEIIDSLDIIVDSVYYVANKKHIQFGNLESQIANKKFAFIEGVGVTYGFDYRRYSNNIILKMQVKREVINYWVDLFGFDDICAYDNLGTKEQEIGDELNFQVYPNPINTGNVFISNNDSNTSYYYKVTSIDGKTFISGKFLGNANLDISILNSGMYFIRISTLQGAQLFIKKIIKL